MHIFCTLFDSHYLSRGLAMYRSLAACSSDFHLYIFCFDDITRTVLRSLKLECVTLISLPEFEDADLLRVKPTRSPAEYCWTSTASVILYVLEKTGAERCTYIDADLFFYNDPLPLFEEMGDRSILITEHRYSPENDLSALSGVYCVQFISFRKDEHGLKALNWWRNACLEWCYAREEDGKFGDQKYLDDWTGRFENLHVLKHQGGGTAPWNIQQYVITKNSSSFNGRVIKTGESFPLIFYHYHHIRFYLNGMLDLGDYRISKCVKENLYFPYLRELAKAGLEITAIAPDIDPHGSKPWPDDWRTKINMVKRTLKGRYQFISIREALEQDLCRAR
jgi:hypothetical protein